MEPKKLLTILTLVLVVLFTGCKKDNFVETPGVCPLVQSTDPANAATGVPLNKVITATFNESMDPSTITTSTFTIAGAAKGESLAEGAVSYSGSTATFTPSVKLLPNTTYTGTITKAVKDLNGLYLQADYVWTFKTASVPTVTLVDPLDVATAVVLNKVVSATFSETMDPLTITTSTFTLMNGAIAVPGAVAYSGTTATFTPTSPLLLGTTYTATVNTGANSSNGVALASNYVWTFKTASVPTITLVDPLDLATAVALNKVVSATFSEKMDSLTITTSTFILMNGAIPVPGVVAYSGTTATFTPTIALLSGTTYTATVNTGAKSSNSVALASNYVWTFKTASAPTVTLVDPLDLATAVALNKVVSATFSEKMDSLTITTSTFILMNGAIPVPGVVAYSGTKATFTPTSALLLGKTYTATVNTGAKSSNGVALASNYVWTFSTGAVIAPTVIVTDPLGLAISVPLNKVITATFSVPMNPSTITTSTFMLKDGLLPIVGAVTYAGSTATFTPASPLLTGKTYTATITNAVKNVAGTAMLNNYVWAFSTGASVAPTVIDTDPLDMEIDVLLNKVISVTFSTAMDQTTITTSTFTLMDGLTPITGVVAGSGINATFTPGSPLLAGKTYTATVTNLAKNLAGTPMVSDYVWSFTTPYSLTVVAVNGVVVKNPDQLLYNNGTTVQLTATADAGYVFDSWSGGATGILNPASILMNANKNVTANFILATAVCTPAVDLGLSGNYVILSESGISTTGVTSVVGNMGISPAAATLITGFALTLPAGGAFSTSSLVTGNIYAPGYAAPTPANLTTAITNMTTAFTTGNGLAAGTTELLAGNLNSQTLAPGVYKWGTGLLITTGLTLDGGGDPCASWVFQIAGDLTVANSTIITLANGAKAKNVFWIVAGSKAQLGTAVDFSGNILCKTLISLNTGAKVLGRLLAQTAVTLNASTVTLP